MMGRYGLTLLLAALAFDVFAGQAIDFEAIAEMEVPAQGAAKVIQIFDIERAAQNEAVQTRLKNEVAQRIARWEFQPAEVDGAAVDTRTFVRVKMEAQVNSDNTFTVRVLVAATGPRARYRVRPAYPKAAVKAGAEGDVILMLQLDPKGDVISVLTEKSDTSPGSGAMRNTFEAVAARSAKLWRFQNETVSGQPVPSRVRLPFQFCMSDASSWCGRLPDTLLGEIKEDLIALDPAAKLMTDVREKEG